MADNKRCKNVTDVERDMLLDLIKPQISIIENVKTDGTTNKIKLNTWENIRLQYNAMQSTGSRTVVQLKAMFDTMKRKSKKTKSSEKVKTYINQPINHSTTERENDILVDLISTNKSHLIDSNFGNQDEVWETITDSYNQLQTSGMKTVEELKLHNKNLQKSAKLDLSKEKSQTYKTGGGQIEHQSSSISTKVIGMMGNRFLPLENPNDCDGDFPSIQLENYEKSPDSTENTSFYGGSPIYFPVGLDDINIDTTDDAMGISVIHEVTDKPNEKEANLQPKTKNKVPTSPKLYEKLPKNKNATRSTATKVYDNLETISNQRVGQCTVKDKFNENYNDLKIKRAKIQLEIAEIEKNMLIEKSKSDKEHYTSINKQDMLREKILEYELEQKSKSCD